jgi:hypothetical protein
MAGRPTKYKAEFAEQAAKLCALGATDREIADFFEVTERTFNNWKGEYPELFQSLKLAKEAADKRVEQSLYRRALGYSHDTVHVSNYQGEVTLTPIVEHYPPDTTACIFWLKNRRPEDWRDVKAVEHSGNVNHRDARELTEADLDALILERARGGKARKAPGKKEPPGVH